MKYTFKFRNLRVDNIGADPAGVNGVASHPHFQMKKK